MGIDGIYDLKFTSGLAYASGTADRNGATLDMAGYDGVIIKVKMATIAAGAVTTFKAQYGDESDLSDAADISGASISIAADDDDQMFLIDIKRPTKRYIRGVMDKDASNATAEVMDYIQYNARNRPVTNTVTDAVTTDRVTGV